MEILRLITDVKLKIGELKKENKTVGFVPTMGALHKGHLSLVEQSKANNNITVVSIFVNPTQFNNKADLEKYPKTIEADTNLLEQHSVDAVFIPEYSEIYPDENSTKVHFELGNLDKVMEGKYRPGHFNGVAMVVKRLFEITLPSKAYFGQKDIQQFTILNYLNNNYLKQMNIKLKKCPIVRESDGLAMSSRNRLLTDEQRKEAAVISKTLFAAKDMYKDFSIEEIEQFVKNEITQNTKFEIDYFEIVNSENLQKISNNDKSQPALACIAVNVTDSLRLIDNVEFEPKES